MSGIAAIRARSPGSSAPYGLVKDSLSFDIGFCHAIIIGARVNEIRTGLTVASLLV
jgi:hypothetical protein